MDNKNKVVLITGASSGMGKETAKCLLNENYTVYAVARRVEKMADLKKMGAHILKMDITKSEDIEAVIKTIAENHKGVDVLINNAGYGLYGAMEDTSIEDARYQFEVNLFGLARITQLVLPYMREQKAGRIINMSSMGGKIYFPLGAWYHGSKHALEGWSDSLRLEVAGFGIQVVIIEPGTIQTEFGEVMAEPMIKRSGNTAYAAITKGMAESTKNSYERGGSSDPSVITRLISKAISAKRPKTRYVAGKWAKPLIFIRKWFGDRIFDWIVMSSVRH